MSSPTQSIGRRTLSADEISALSAFLADSARPEGTLSFHELQGLLFAVACCPELVLPAEWLPIISNDEDMGYEDLDEAERTLNQIMALYNQINTSVIERDDSMPIGCEFLPETEANLGSEAPVSQWARGFTLGHNWLAEAWEAILPDEDDELGQELGACMMILSFFGSVQLAEALYDEGDGQHRRATRQSFEQFAELMRKLFPEARRSYAHLGRTIAEVLARPED
jgi:yecA family protein